MIRKLYTITRDAILGLTELPALHSLAREATDKRVDDLAKKRAVEYCNTNYDQDIANLTEDRDDLRKIVVKLSDEISEACIILSYLSSSLGSGLGGENESLISMVTRILDGLKAFVDHTNNFAGEQRASVEKLTTELKGAREFERSRSDTQERRIKDILDERDVARKERDDLETQLAAEQQIVKKLGDALRGAEDYLGNFEMENLERIGKVEFLYIRDALKCLRETDCL
jgi:polyhydroxyalkanoate synthesis regulator phasin